MIKNKLISIQDQFIFLVIKEIESWYLAGLDRASSRSLKVRYLSNTDDVTKEKFNNSIPKRFDSRIDFMVEILNNFSIKTSMNKNTSFKYFTEKNNLTSTA
jgi:hypothetical protein